MIIAIVYFKEQQDERLKAKGQRLAPGLVVLQKITKKADLYSKHCRGKTVSFQKRIHDKNKKRKKSLMKNSTSRSTKKTDDFFADNREDVSVNDDMKEPAEEVETKKPTAADLEKQNAIKGVLSDEF